MGVLVRKGEGKLEIAGVEFRMGLVTEMPGNDAGVLGRGQKLR